MTVNERFDVFYANIQLTSAQRADGAVKHAGIRSALNSHYYGNSSESSNSFPVGSWGKGTQVRPPRDIDVLFELPSAVYERFQQRSGNKQAQLLQEVKSVLSRTYVSTKMRADGQVVVVPFASYGVEVLPAFRLTDGQYWICDTNDGGRYKTADPKAELAVVASANSKTNGNAVRLIKMLKTWQRVCSVPIKSFVLEHLAIEFLASYQYAGNSSVYHDWMTRDFFAWLISTYTFSWQGFLAPGTSDYVVVGTDWTTRARSAWKNADEACKNEAGGWLYLAGSEWQKIYGDDIPVG